MTFQQTAFESKPGNDILISEGQIPRPLVRFKNQLKIMVDTPLLVAG